MNLSATVTSERASKGQGGKHIDITLYDDKRQIIGELSFLADQFGYVLVLNGYSPDVLRFQDFERATPKGEKCNICGADLYGMIRTHHHN